MCKTIQMKIFAVYPDIFGSVLLLFVGCNIRLKVIICFICSSMLYFG